MTLNSRVKTLEEQVGIVASEPTRRRTIFIVYVDPGVIDADGNRIGGGTCDPHQAAVWVDGHQRHFERAAGETVDDFKGRLAKIPWGINPIKVIFLWSDGDSEPVPRENAPKVEP